MFSESFLFLYSDATTFLHGYVTFFETKNNAVLTKLLGVSIFVSILHCPLDYCIPDYLKNLGWTICVFSIFSLPL